MAQHEKPGISPVELAALFGQKSHEGLRVSGGQMVDFRRGWAHSILNACRRNHYFVADGEIATSLCGVTVALGQLYGEGNYEQCQNCDTQLLKGMRRRR